MATKKKAGPKNRALEDMRRYYNGLDLAALTEEFRTSIDTKTGKRLYRTAREFAMHAGQSETQRSFLAWLFGPTDQADPVMEERYSWIKPFGLDHLRDSGWFEEGTLKEYSSQIRREVTALEALRSAGNGVIVHSLVRMEKLAEQLDRDFGARFLVEGLTFKQNMERAEMYLKLHQQLLRMLAVAQDLYAKSHGINFQDMSGFERLLTAQALMLRADGKMQQSRTDQIIGRVIDMTLEKNVKHGIALPAQVERAVIETAQQPSKPPRM